MQEHAYIVHVNDTSKSQNIIDEAIGYWWKHADTVYQKLSN